MAICLFESVVVVCVCVCVFFFFFSFYFVGGFCLGGVVVVVATLLGMCGGEVVVVIGLLRR